ncbi:hypothetical protein QWY31_00520 [Cytophagales bacterium LB-30]|uniref:Uncharacterized protein n=1 Tax=Shiella aurantiaca TaxID=3058365 RepID=A0ABT8F136_9BACT|nr:hypothetical protein [Shiella aurantiaca]MDN4163959.1 hypothetical protein [Shiella aurantiaca]
MKTSILLLLIISTPFISAIIITVIPFAFIYFIYSRFLGTLEFIVEQKNRKNAKSAINRNRPFDFSKLLKKDEKES